MSDSAFIVGHIRFTEAHFRTSMIEKMDQLAKLALKTEPNTLKYAALVPIYNDDGKSFWTIEQYASTDARDAHFSTRESKEAIQWIMEETKFDGAVSLNHYQYISHDLWFTSSDLSPHSDPYIVYTDIEYEKGEASKNMIPYLEKITHLAREEEPECLMHWVLGETANDNKVGVISAYQGKEKLREKAALLEKFQVGSKSEFLRLAGGFLCR